MKNVNLPNFSTVQLVTESFGNEGANPRTTKTIPRYHDDAEIKMADHTRCTSSHYLNIMYGLLKINV